MSYVRGVVSDDEYRLIDGLIRSLPMPAGVAYAGLRFDTDATDAPAVWIMFKIRDGEPDQNQIYDLTRKASDLIWDSATTRIPYVRFVEA